MAIELSREDQEQALASIDRFFREHMDEPIGRLGANRLLGFLLEEVGPTIYNRAVADAQARMAARIAELDIDVQEEEFPYWRQRDNKTPGRRR